MAVMYKAKDLCFAFMLVYVRYDKTNFNIFNKALISY